MENMETQGRQNTSDNTRLDRKIRTIRFILLSVILYFLTDAIGRWFVPAQDSVPGLYTMMLWILCFISSRLFRCRRHISSMTIGIVCRTGSLLFGRELPVVRIASDPPAPLSSRHSRTSFLTYVENIITLFQAYVKNK